MWQFVFIMIGAFQAGSGSPREILIASFCGLAYLPIMISFTTPSLNYLRLFRFRPGRWINHTIMNGVMSLTILVDTLKEELVWRVALVWLARQMMIDDVLIIFTGALCFYGIHWIPRPLVILMTEFELFLFSLLLYIVYIKTASLIGVWIIHILRNSYIHFCRNGTENAQ